MSTINLVLEDDVAALLHDSNQSIHRAVIELLTLELFRRGKISSGKAAQLLDMSRVEFINYASRLGIAFFDMTEDEWTAEKNRLEER